MKTELLVQMDGLAKTDDLVFLLAASNLPWSVLRSHFYIFNQIVAVNDIIAGVYPSGV